MWESRIGIERDESTIRCHVSLEGDEKSCSEILSSKWYENTVCV